MPRQVGVLTSWQPGLRISLVPGCRVPVEMNLRPGLLFQIKKAPRNCAIRLRRNWKNTHDHTRRWSRAASAPRSVQAARSFSSTLKSGWIFGAEK